MLAWLYTTHTTSWLRDAWPSDAAAGLSIKLTMMVDYLLYVCVSVSLCSTGVAGWESWSSLDFFYCFVFWF